MTYQVKLEVFEGPFDLLLHLIAKRKVDIYEVDLAEITADFLASLEGIEDLDLETATRFLVVAATLIELKAARLLPTDEQEELEDLLGEARDLLYARLLEYRAFRDAARHLEARLLRHGGRYGREVPLEPRFQRLVPETPLPITVADLARLAARATAPAPPDEIDLTHIRRSYISIREAAEQVLARLPGQGRPHRFTDLVAGRSRGDRVVFFLALLELYKLGHLDLAQEHHRAELHVERLDGGRDLASITEDETPETDEDDGTPDQGDQETTAARAEG